MPGSSLDLRTALKQGQTLLEQCGIAAPRLTAEVLLAHAIGCDRAYLVAHATDPLKEVWWIHYGRYLHERMAGKPTQYITGHQEFYGRDFHVTRDVLIPRPETEHLIEAALPHALGKVLDVGAGSGAIAVTLALESGSHVVATDVSLAALTVAAANAKRLDARVSFLACDLGTALREASFDLVVSNPPYVPQGDTLPREVREHEPGIALYAGVDGLAVYRRLIPEAARLLKPGGWLIMELGYGLNDAVHAMLGDWDNVETSDDLAGIPRVISARKL